MTQRNLLLVPFAYKPGAETGANIRHKSSSFDIYIKNCCVALVSARKHNNEDTDCALVTNVRLPQKYSDLLCSYGIKIFYQDFDRFYFGDKYKWSLAFYKLCALYSIVRDTLYDNYAYLDSDCIIQSSLAEVWDKCRSNILMYDVTELDTKFEYEHFRNEVLEYNKVDNVVHWGGEFFAASRQHALEFSDSCLRIFTELRGGNYITSHGDEFILSLASQEFSSRICNACEFVSRIWTGTYRNVPSNYSNVVVLHLPAEKEYSIIKLYNKYILYGKNLPEGLALYKTLNILSPSFITRLKNLIKRILLKR